MKSKGVVVILILMFALAVGAGAVAAKLTTRVPQPSPTPIATKGTLADVLKLTPDQSSQMQQIWEQVRAVSHDCVKDAEQIERDDDTALQAMLTDDQKAKFNELRAHSRDKLKALAAKRDRAFNDALERTRPILTDNQRKLYEQIIKDRGIIPDQAGSRSGHWDLSDTSQVSR